MEMESCVMEDALAEERAWAGQREDRKARRTSHLATRRWIQEEMRAEAVVGQQLQEGVSSAVAVCEAAAGHVLRQPQLERAMGCEWEEEEEEEMAERSQQTKRQREEQQPLLQLSSPCASALCDDCALPPSPLQCVPRVASLRVQLALLRCDACGWTDAHACACGADGRRLHGR